MSNGNETIEKKSITSQHIWIRLDRDYGHPGRRLPLRNASGSCRHRSGPRRTCRACRTGCRVQDRQHHGQRLMSTPVVDQIALVH